MKFNYDAFDLSAEKKEELGKKILLHRRYSALMFRVLEYDEDSITIRVKQDYTFHGNRFDAKKMSDITKETFSAYSQGRSIHVRAVFHRESATDVVNPEWIKSKMSTHKVKNKDMVAAFGIAKAEISAYVNGHRTMTQPVKAMFYYYFTGLEK